MKIPRWSRQFISRLTLTAAFAVFMVPLAVSAQGPLDQQPAIPAVQMTGVPIAGVVGNQVVVYDGLGNPTVLNVPADSIQTYVWNEDGSKLAIVAYTGSGQTQLYVASVDTGALFSLNISRLEGFPPAFLGNDTLLVVTQPENADYTQGYVSSIQQIAAQEGALPVDVGTFTWSVGCGGGSPYPSDWLYWGETGFGGSQLTFVVTPFGVLHSTSCSGSGLALFNLQTGVDAVIPNSQDIGSLLALSADKTYVIASYNLWGDTPINQVVRLDLGSFTVTPLPLAHDFEQIAVDENGVVYYSLSVASGDLLSGLTPDQRTVVMNAFGMSPDWADAQLPIGTGAVYRFDPSTGVETTVADSLDAYVTTRITPLESNTLMFSVVPNMTRYVEALISGTVDPASAAMLQQLMPVTVYLVSTTGDSAPMPVITGLTRFSVRPTT